MYCLLAGLPPYKVKDFHENIFFDLWMKCCIHIGQILMLFFSEHIYFYRNISKQESVKYFKT